MNAPDPIGSKPDRCRLPAVIAAAICIQAAQGIFDVSLPLRAKSAGLSTTAFGWTGAANALGFLAGAFLAPAALRRIGGFGMLAAACLLASPLALLGWSSSRAIWLAIRLAAGFSFAIMFASTDTAVLDSAPVEQRSRAIGIYVMFERLATMVMPFAFAGSLAAPMTLVCGLGCLWACLIPGRALKRSHPFAPRSPLKLFSTFHSAWMLAPAAVLCAFAAGALNSSTLVLLPRWVDGELGEKAVPLVQAAAWCGALTVQLSVGFLARSSARTSAGIWLSPAAGMALLCIPIAATSGLGATTIAGVLLGVSGFSQYGLALIALGEAAAQRDQQPPSSSLVFAWGLGAVLGPMSCSALGLYAQPDRLFSFVGLVWLTLPLATFALNRRASHRHRRKSGFVTAPAPSD